MLIQCGIIMEPNKQLKWCFNLKDVLRMAEPNERLAKSYLEESKSSLKRAEKNFKDKDLLWTTVVIYYAEYYALYSFLQRIGIKCENHFCSILAAGFILGGDKTMIINSHKDKRIDAQYYMKIGKEEEEFLGRVMKRYSLSPRAYHRILKVGRTIADLGERENMTMEDISLAVRMRHLDRAPDY